MGGSGVSPRELTRPRCRDPAPDVLGRLGHVLDDQVRGRGVALDVGVRQPPLQVGQVLGAEHRITGTPQEQGRYVGQPRQAVRDPLQRGPARMVRLQRNIGHEITDGSAQLGPAVRLGESIADLRRKRGP